MTVLGSDRCLQKTLAELPATTAEDRGCVGGVIAELGRAFAEQFEGGMTVAFLLSRPGSDPISEEDRCWAALVVDAAARAAVPLEPFFRANDVSLVRVRPDS
jgi:hypothetical protein